MLYALMVGDFDSRDIHSAYSKRSEAERMAELIEEQTGHEVEIVPVALDVCPRNGEHVWRVVVENGEVVSCTRGRLDERGSLAFANNRLSTYLVAGTPEEAIGIARQQWDAHLTSLKIS